jgi:uncharacterized protein (TIGR02231 family)
MNGRKVTRRLCLPAAVGAALLCLTSGSHANDASKITAVTLYPGGATVERTAPITPGMTRVEISGVPANFDPQTLRVEAGPGVQVGEVSALDVARTQTPNAREALLEERIQTLKDKQSSLDAEIKSAEMVNNFLSRLGTPGEKAAPIADAKSLSGMVDLIRRGADDSLARVQRAQVQKREIGKRIAALERELARLKSGSRDSRTILVGVSAERMGAVRISYQVNNAGWRPTYRANLDSAASQLELIRQGVVQQTTGEDWSAVKLKLSTGQPRLSPRGSEPRPWLVSLPSVASPRALGRTAAEAPAALRDLRMDAAVQVPIEIQTTFSSEFEVPGLVSLPSDGRKVTVSLATLTLPAKMRLHVVPRLDPTAIVTAEAKRPDGVWLPGEIQLQRDGSMVGATRWNPQASTSLVLPFGRDNLVRVTLDRVKDRNGTAGLIERRNEREVTDVMTLSSLHKTPLDLLVLESSPVSTSDSITVKTAYDPKPQVQNWEDRQGIVGWERSIAPNETVKITVGYTIGYPKEATVVGLP